MLPFRTREALHRARARVGGSFGLRPLPAAPAGSLRPGGAGRAFSVFATQVKAPFPTVMIYNQSKHACQSVLADFRAVWGPEVRVLQVVEEGNQQLPGMDGAFYIQSKKWGDLAHFEARLDAACSQDHVLHRQRKANQVVFMPGWSAFAESPDTARAVSKLGLVWPGTEPVASAKLEKIGFKQICQSLGAPTPSFCVLSAEGASVNLGAPATRAAVVEKYMAAIAGMGSSDPGLIKSVHGGGGKGTAHLDDPSNPALVREAIDKVLNEMNRSDGIYFEEKVNTKGDGRFFQLELEVDGETVAHGGRFVWFNSRLQKVVEIGLSDAEVTRFMPEALYLKSREWSAQIARAAKNNTRATMEALVFEDENGEHQLQFIECNRRPQVENEALALLQQDAEGNRRYTFAELAMRAAGHAAPAFQPSSDAIQVVLHARWLHGNPDQQGNIAYQPGHVTEMGGPRLDWVVSEALAPGEISFAADPQLGKAVIVAGCWEQMCDRAALYFKSRRPKVQGSVTTYAQTMQNLFSSPAFRAGTIASNETFASLEIPDFAARSVEAILEEQVSPVLVQGYRPGEGSIYPDRYPTQRVCNNLAQVTYDLQFEQARETAFSRYARGDASYEEYMEGLRGQLSNQGGAWVTVAPRDTAQQGNDSESAAITNVSRRNAEIWAERAGCVGYEIGGAQYQAALIRGFDPAAVCTLGLPSNIAAHSLQRSQYVNGLAELPPSISGPLFQATADLVHSHYRGEGAEAKQVPWAPYNFHAGNYVCPDTGYSPQDETTGMLLEAKTTPLPNWVFSPHFNLDQLAAWTQRQISLFDKHGRQLQQVRIKNPGQGRDWTATTVWAHVNTIRGVFKTQHLPEPVIYIHNHDFNGMGGHIAAELLKLAHADGYPFLVIDAAYRKNNTHNDNTVVLSALQLQPEQREAMVQYNTTQQQIEHVLRRFDSRSSQMTPWDSDWAGGTEGSDLRIAKEYGLAPRQINLAKEVASAVFPLERAVTPFSEYKLRLGIGIMIEEGIEPKTQEQVRAWIAAGGKLKVGGDVLVGLLRWQTLVDKPPVVDQLLANMAEELEDALGAKNKLVRPEDLSPELSAAQRFTALGFQQKGLDFLKAIGSGKGDLTPLLLAPHLLHRYPLTLSAGSCFSLLLPDRRATEVEFLGFGSSPTGDILLGYKHEGRTLTVAVPDPNARVGGGEAASGPAKADPSDPCQLGTVVPGELLAYSVTVGDVLKAGQPFCVLESMKMEVKIPVPQHLDGHVVSALPNRGRTAEAQGDILSPGHLLIVAEPAPEPVKAAAPPPPLRDPLEMPSSVRMV